MVDHTPGPWSVEEYGDLDMPALVIHRDSESRICFMATPGSMGDPEQIEADAYLIAAAPDLLAAAKLVLAGLDARIQEAIDAGSRAVPVFNGIAELSDAINRATGAVRNA